MTSNTIQAIDIGFGCLSEIEDTFLLRKTGHTQDIGLRTFEQGLA